MAMQIGTFLKQKGNYRNLIAYQKAECIYDITYYFAHTYLAKGGGIREQMTRARIDYRNKTNKTNKTN